MRKIGFTLTLVSLFILVACSTTNRAIKRNWRATEKTVQALCERNGNAFYATSTYSTFSFVWTYAGDSLEIYKLLKGKRQLKQVVPGVSLSLFSGKDIEDGMAELSDNSIMELDGDLVGFCVEMDGKRYEYTYPGNIDSLKQGQYESAFINRIVNDMNSYGIWQLKI